MSDFSTLDIQFLPGVGTRKAGILKEELRIYSYEDLLYYFPYKYVDRTRFYTIAELSSSLPQVQVRGYIRHLRKEGNKYAERLIAEFYDHTGSLELVWFKGVKYLMDQLKPNVEYIAFAKPSTFNRRLTMAHPEMEAVKDAKIEQRPSLQAFYQTSEKMKGAYLHSKGIQKLQHTLSALLKSSGMPETLPGKLTKGLGLMRLQDALIEIHFPSSPDKLRAAQYRLKFEELFYIQLSLLQQRQLKAIKYKGFIFNHIGTFFNTFYQDCIPFELTGAQKRVLREIRQDTKTGKQMNRLIQGDVGSGKTMVALMAMLMAIDNDYQACIMAPTEILAEQHYQSILDMTEGLDIEVVLLTGSTKAKARKPLLESLQAGGIHILIGTHAVLEEPVVFKNLGLVVIDEQHRFGVAQRAKLWKKNTYPPHVLVMTATPIPRTLAMTLYGDLDISVIDELPPGRKPVSTHHYFDNKREAVYNFIKKQLAMKHQVYIVYPLIQESEKLDLKNLETGYKELQAYFPASQYSMCMVHGKMPSQEKQEAMERFSSGAIDIMVATTVIEVGVNVPNASVMVIESSERFGLSQLHQLRGRVGRGAKQSYCILLSTYKLSTEGRKRLETMVKTNDGFEIAEVDLSLRGPGDLKGTQQSGIPFDLRIANLARDGGILQFARKVALQILEQDPTLEQDEHLILRVQLKKMTRNKINWSSIS